MKRLAIGIGAAAALAAGEADAQRFTLRAERVSVHNVAGEVRVEAGSGSEVVVEVERRGEDADRLRVERGREGEGERVAVLYPGDRVVYPAIGRSNSTVSVRRDGIYGGDGSGGLLRGRRITVTGSGRGTRAWADVVVRVPAGRTVAVHQAVGTVEVRNVRGDLRVNTASAPVRAAGTRGALDVDVGSGGVSVSDAEGSVRIDTGSGGVRVNDVRGPLLEVDTGSGGVTGSGVDAERVVVDVGSGGVDLERVSARDVTVDTGSGAVDLALTGDARSVRIDTGSGGVTLTVPRGFGAELTVETGSGGIDVDVPVEGRRSSRGSFSGRIGDGDGRVVIDAGSGGVRIRGN